MFSYVTFRLNWFSRQCSGSVNTGLRLPGSPCMRPAAALQLPHGPGCPLDLVKRLHRHGSKATIPSSWWNRTTPKNAFASAGLTMRPNSERLIVLTVRRSRDHRACFLGVLFDFDLSCQLTRPSMEFLMYALAAHDVLWVSLLCEVLKNLSPSQYRK